MNEAARMAKSRYEEIANRLSQPDAASDTNRYAALMREYRELEPIAECAEKVLQAENAIAEAEDLLSDASIDDDFKAMAQEQLDENKEKLVSLSEELQLLLLPKDPNDKKSLQIPVVNTERCIGCGACENLCPSRPFSAIYVEGHEVHREI